MEAYTNGKWPALKAEVYGKPLWVFKSPRFRQNKYGEVPSIVWEAVSNTVSPDKT